jgi:hypothetical protein
MRTAVNSLGSDASLGNKVATCIRRLTSLLTLSSILVVRPQGGQPGCEHGYRTHKLKIKNWGTPIPAEPGQYGAWDSSRSIRSTMLSLKRNATWGRDTVSRIDMQQNFVCEVGE